MKKMILNIILIVIFMWKLNKSTYLKNILLKVGCFYYQRDQMLHYQDNLLLNLLV